MRTISIVLLTVIGLATPLALPAIAQRHLRDARMHSHDSRMYFDYGDPLMTSVIQSPDGRTLDVRLATASSMFSFLRSHDATRGAYYAIRDVTVQVTEDGSTQPVVAHDRTDTLFVSTFEQSTAKNDWHTTDEQLALPTLDPKKSYSVRVEVRDGIDRQVMPAVVTPLRASAFTNTPDSNGIAIGDVMLIDSLQGTNATTGVRGNTYMFSRDMIAAAQFQIAETLKGEPSVDIRVRQVLNRIDPADTGERGHLTLSSSELHRDSAFTFKSAGNNMTYALLPDSVHGRWTALFTVPGKSFEQGKYEITVRVKVGPAQREHKNSCMILWQGMPLSLEDPSDAVEPLAHILTSDHVSAISSGSKSEQMHKLYDYWRTQDPSPGTAYNERMAAFYQRVDYADFNFANSHLLNGVMTDRGKIYLLYGPPTNIDRTFIPGDSPVEVWTYSNNVQRIFRFEDPGHHGEYHLTNVENLAAKN